MDTREKIKDYYSKVTTEDGGKMQSSVCSCSTKNMPRAYRKIIRKIDKEIKDHFYGCGSPIPDVLAGQTVLDLGCGTGRDCYLISKLVGEEGHVIGVDMNEDQLAIAKKHQDKMASQWGFKQSNLTFKQGYIEDLQALDIEDESIDIVISNCVINLSPFKEAVFKEIWRVLKPGGELYFSDVFVDRRLPKAISEHPVLQGECLGGALYTEDFRRLMNQVGWLDFRYTNTSKSAINNPKLEAIIGNANFYSRTVRAFKLPALLEDRCENYGQIAIYQGDLPGSEQRFALDDTLTFYRDEPQLVCGNTAAMLEETRFAPYFKILGDRSQHFGSFQPKAWAGEPLTSTSCQATSSASSPTCGGSGCC